MSIIKRITACLLALSLCFSLCSCLNSESLEEYGYVLTVGLDKGTMFKYSISFMMESEKSQSEEQSSSDTNIITAEGDNIYEAIYTAESGLPYRLNFSRANYIIISYDVAADGEIMEFFSTSWSMLKVRTSVNMLISKSTAREFINGLTYTNEVNTTKMENNLMEYYKTRGLTAMMSIANFMTAAESSYYDPVVPLGSTDNSVENEANEAEDTTEGTIRYGGMVAYKQGAALFSGSIMCGVLSAKENQVLMIMQGKMPGLLTQFTREDGTNYTVLLANSEKPNIKISWNGDNPKLKYDILLKAILVQESSFERMNKMRKSGKLEKDMEETIISYMHYACDTVFRECRDLDCDALGIGKYVCREFKTVKAWEEYDFKKHYKNVECDFNIDIDVQDIYMSTGME